MTQVSSKVPCPERDHAGKKCLTVNRMAGRPTRDLLLTAVAPVLWGTTYFVTTQFLPPHRPFFVSVMRALPIGLLILAVFPQRPTGVWWWRTFLLGALNIGLFFALLFIATYRLPGGLIATMNAFQPIIVSMLAWMFLDERLTLRVVWATCAGVFGISLIVLVPSTHLDLVGLIVAFAATTTWSIGTVLTKLWGQPVPLLLFTAWQLVAGGLTLLPIALLVEGGAPGITMRNVVGFLYLGVLGTGLAYALWFRGIERLKASTVTFLALLSPVSALTVDFLILHRRMSVLQVTGIAIVLGSIFLAQRNNESVVEKVVHD